MGYKGSAPPPTSRTCIPCPQKLREFGLTVLEINGHDPGAILSALNHPPGERPSAIVATTVKGHGVSFMENKMEWHYLPMTAEQYRTAVGEVERHEDNPFEISHSPLPGSRLRLPNRGPGIHGT